MALKKNAVWDFVQGFFWGVGTEISTHLAILFVGSAETPEIFCVQNGVDSNIEYFKPDLLKTSKVGPILYDIPRPSILAAK